MKALNFLIIYHLIFMISSVAAADHDSLNSLDGNQTLDKSFTMRSVDEKNGFPKETQMAQCTVSTGEIKASAQATFSKKLEGFCSTQDMEQLNRRLFDMETRLSREIFQLKKIIIKNLFPRDYQQFLDEESEMLNQRYVPLQSSRKYESTTKNYERPTTTSTSERTPPQVLLKSLETPRMKSRVQETTTEVPTTKTPEVTTAAAPLPTKNEYTYYWKLNNFPKAFEHAKNIFSHVFSVKGLFLRIRATLFEDNENLVLDTEQLANVDNLERMEIEVSDGLIFKEIVEEELFQFSFEIIDQFNTNHNLISQIYRNNDIEGFSIPNSIHVLSNYLKNDSLLIKLSITF